MGTLYACLLQGALHLLMSTLHERKKHPISALGFVQNGSVNTGNTASD
jgi:hypothetical protein